MLPQETGPLPLTACEMNKTGRSIYGPAGFEIENWLDNHPGVILSIAGPGHGEKQNTNELLCA